MIKTAADVIASWELCVWIWLWCRLRQHLCAWWKSGKRLHHNSAWGYTLMQGIQHDRLRRIITFWLTVFCSTFPATCMCRSITALDLTGKVWFCIFAVRQWTCKMPSGRLAHHLLLVFLSQDTWRFPCFVRDLAPAREWRMLHWCHPWHLTLMHSKPASIRQLRCVKTQHLQFSAKGHKVSVSIAPKLWTCSGRPHNFEHCIACLQLFGPAGRESLLCCDNQAKSSVQVK